MYRLNRFALIIFMLATLIASGWVALHLRAGIEWRDQPELNLSQAQRTRLKNLPPPITLTAYVNGNPRLRRALLTQFNTLQRLIPALQYHLQNPDTDPIGVQKHNITQNGQLYLQVGEHGQRLDTPAPEAIIRTIFQLDQSTRHRLVHLQDNGERAYLSDTGGSWQALYQNLNNPQLDTAAVGLTQAINIPENADLAVIADPAPNQHPAHLNAAIQTYLNQGGNLIYSTDTQHPYLPPILEQISGLQILPGIVVDTAGRSLGLADPRTIPAAVNSHSEIGKALTNLPLLLGSIALEPNAAPENGWSLTPLLKSSPQSWNETGEISGHIELDNHETRGPLTLAWLLTRPYQGRQQTLLILGDSDLFTQNALGLGGNRELANLAIAQLSHSTQSQAPTRAPLKDQYIQQSKHQDYLLASLLLLALPLLSLLGLSVLRRGIRRHYRRLITASQTPPQP